MGKKTAYDIERKQAEPNRVIPVGHRVAWKHYVRGNVVSEFSVTLITNIVSACSQWPITRTMIRRGTKKYKQDIENIARGETNMYMYVCMYMYLHICRTYVYIYIYIGGWGGLSVCVPNREIVSFRS